MFLNFDGKDLYCFFEYSCLVIGYLLIFLVSLGL